MSGSMQGQPVAKALYRLPHAARYCRLTQHGTPVELPSCAELGAEQGFVVAPFAPSPEQPIVLIRPDEVEWADVPETEDAADGFAARVVDAEGERARYGIDFRNFHAQLTSGEFDKVVLARCSHMEAGADVEAQAERLFFRACRRYPRMCVVLVSAPRCGTWLMATPEILLQGSGREWQTMALAGTMRLAPRHLDFDTPHARTSAADISWSAKNRFEQRYVADYIEECVEQFATDIDVSEPYTTRAGDLVHLRTDFRFTLPDGCPIGSIVNALHPTPAVCGMPKDATFAFITHEEQTPRSYYSGFVGPMGIGGESHLFVSLRCMRIEGRRLFLYAGGGLLPDSREDDEWLETEAKMETMRSLLEL